MSRRSARPTLVYVQVVRGRLAITNRAGFADQFSERAQHRPVSRTGVQRVLQRLGIRRWLFVASVHDRVVRSVQLVRLGDQGVDLGL
jgi:hypothetical protein